MTKEQYEAALKVAFDAGWYAAIHEAADTAQHLNGWGTETAPEVTEHIAKCIRALAPEHSQSMPPEWNRNP
jgi:hypothetical protein